MPTNASSGLVTALKSSLANAAASWCVVGIAETTALVGVAGTIAEGAGTITTTTRTETRVFLASPKVRAASDSPSPLRIEYVSIKLGGSYSDGHIVANGVHLRTTDAALDATVLALAGAYATAQDAALRAALTDGPSAAPSGVMPSAVVSALAARIADVDAGWGVQSRTDFVLPSGRTITVVMSSLDVTFAAVMASAPDMRVPAVVTYSATLSAAGSLIDAVIIANGTGLRAADALLHAAVMALADDWLSDQQSDIASAVS